VLPSHSTDRDDSSASLITNGTAPALRVDRDAFSVSEIALGAISLLQNP
jgi:hypothetical protein